MNQNNREIEEKMVHVIEEVIIKPRLNPPSKIYMEQRTKWSLQLEIVI